MQRLAALCMLIATPGMAGAHETAGDASIVERLGHEIFGLHHLPVSIILVVACVLLYRMRARKASRTR